MVELIRGDGTLRRHEVGSGDSNTSECSAERRACSHCGSRRRLQDVRSRQLLSVFGTVKVRAPRYLPGRCAVTHPHTLSPVAEIMPDRCTPEYERIVAKMGSLLPYARMGFLLSAFLPLDDIPAPETTRRRTLWVQCSVGAAGRSRGSPPHGRPGLGATTPPRRQSRSDSTNDTSIAAAVGGNRSDMGLRAANRGLRGWKPPRPCRTLENWYH